MSRIFNISGNFKQYEYGRWAEPNSSFSGKIIANDNDEFYGCCEGLYDSINIAFNANLTQYLAGAFVQNDRNGQQGIVFYKMFNDPRLDPVMYAVPNLTDPEGNLWKLVCLPVYCFLKRGKVIITIEEEAFSKEAEDSIKTKYDTLDKNIGWNGVLPKQIHRCKDIIIWAT